jgi:ribosomal protein L40E
MANDWNIFFIFWCVTCWTDSLRIKKRKSFYLNFHHGISRVTACRKCAESSLLPRFVHVSFSWWIDRLIVPGNVLPPFFLFNTWLISSNQRRH